MFNNTLNNNNNNNNNNNKINIIIKLIEKRKRLCYRRNIDK